MREVSLGIPWIQLQAAGEGTCGLGKLVQRMAARA
jgi:hypothetical protein